MSYDIAVVGGGPAGLSAALQARQRGKRVLVVSGDDRNNPLYKSEWIDNYLGLPRMSGPELLRRFQEHAVAQGAEQKSGRVLNIMPANGRFYLGVGSDMEEAEAVVLAPGVARAAKLPGEAEHLGRGVSYCATCDGMLYRGRDVIVVGRSSEAPEEANFLQGIGCRVTYISSKESTELKDGIPWIKAGKIEIIGEGNVTAVRVNGEELACAGVFILRAAMAPTDLLPGLELRDGYVAVDRNMATSVPGIFAAGDCTGLPLQISKAVGEGLVAGHRAAEYLDQKEST